MNPKYRSRDRLLTAAFAVLVGAASAVGQTPASAPTAESAGAGPSAKIRLGHSAHGDAFDSGPRQKPWAMPGIGRAPFPITTKNPEVQQWFDQGNALLHSFDYYDAERAFRWCLKIEPGNAMAYWGLALATEARDASGKTRAADFLREAVKRKAALTERERLYIEAWEVILLPDLVKPVSGEAGSDRYSRRDLEHIKRLETLCVKYPDDMEARAYLALANMGDNRYGTELIIREILAHQPNHPGAHHYRIHNWDYHEPEQALESCRVYTEQVPGIGHAQHMPGHIYSIVGMWDEAALSMDAATRVEKRYMQDTLTFTYDNWNYGHNRAYLSYIQEQLGMAAAALAGARQMIDAPLDPQGNRDNLYSTHSQGIRSVARGLLKFQQWDQLLKAGTIPWREIAEDRMNRAYVEARAHFGRRDPVLAQKSIEAHAKLQKDADSDGTLKRIHALQALELRARLALARGETLVGLGLLAEAAEKEFVMQREYADPPLYPEVLYTALGEAYLEAQSPLLAVQAYQRALDLVKNDLFALSGLVRAHTAMNDRAKAADALGRLLFVTRNADAGLKPIELARATGVTAEPRETTPRPQRNYAKVPLDGFGPGKWEPYAAPALDVRDASGQTVTLASYRGKNVILVYYLGSECPHCMEQLQSLAGKKSAWDKLDTVVLAVSSAPADPEAAAIKGLNGAAVRLLSDTDHANARRFRSYDDFEEIELHSTSLIDKEGRVYWARFGGDPFTDLTFLEKQLKRMNEYAAPAPAPAAVQ
ncbi:MAG: redoxin domain-containing protein [Verrucomicrobia bacterium]|nr:redoxin domain-containing protein [Verrucomicrobiota bacterium]